MSEKFREQSQDEGVEQGVNDEITKESKGNKISRRNFLKGVSTLIGSALIDSEQRDSFGADDSISRTEKYMRAGALYGEGLRGPIKRRSETIPESVVKYMVEFERKLKESEDDKFDYEFDDFKKLCLAINKNTPRSKEWAISESLEKKSTKELIVDLSDWALGREARLYVKKRIVPHVYRATVSKYLGKKDFEGVRDIIENIILKNLTDATKKENVDSSIAYLRNSFNHYGQGFLIPPEGYAGNLKIWAYIAESLNVESDYWRDILGKIKK